MTKYSEFVRLTDVKGIVEEVTMPLLQSMRARETEAAEMKTKVAVMQDEMKKCRHDAR